MDPATALAILKQSLELAMKLFNTIRDINSRIKDDEGSLEKLKVDIVDAWSVYAELFKIQLLNNDINGYKSHVNSFIVSLYEIEDLIDAAELKLKNVSRTGRAMETLSNFGRQILHPHQVEQLEKAFAKSVGRWNHTLQNLIAIDLYVSTSSLPFGRIDDYNKCGDMKPELIRCLAYFSLFPSNHGIDKVDLAHLWVGECFFQVDKTSTIMQHIEKYVDDLITKSILQYSGQGRNLQYCGQHFARLAASETCLHLEQGGPSLSCLDNKVRHLSLSREFDKDIWTALQNLSTKLRTFLSLYCEHNRGLLGEIPMELKETLSLLRVLSLTRTDIKQLPNFISKLKHLRYLDVSFSTIEKLPTKFRINHPLQFLKIKKCTNLSIWLTDEVHKLTNLRYVDWEEDFLKKMDVPPRHIGNLTYLENLPFFRVGMQEGRFISELGDMDHLQRSIWIGNLENVGVKLGKSGQIIPGTAEEAKEAAQKAALDRKRDLKTIVLEWNTKSISGARDENILLGLKPHSYVKELRIINYGRNWFPEWITNSQLEKICLKKCGALDLPPLEKMMTLKTLVLEDMTNITHVSCRPAGDADPEFVSFQRLESMECHNMTNLDDWKRLEAQRDFPYLKELKFVNCKRINSKLDFILKLRLSRPAASISQDGECLRCKGKGCNSSVACISSVASTSS